MSSHFFVSFNKLWAQYHQPPQYRMTTMTRDVSHIAKFNGQNFALWKFGCWLLLEQHNLVKSVTGEDEMPAEVFLLIKPADKQMIT